MKKKCMQCIMGFLLLFLSCFSKAQVQTIPEIEVGNRTYSQVFDSLSTGLIPARIPYGILMDRVYGWAGLAEWNSGDTITASRLFQTWYDAEEAYMNPANRPVNYLTMRDTVDNMLYEVKLPVLAFAYQFGFIDSLALQDGRLSNNNGMLTDNNSASPYFSKQVNIAGLATEDVYQNKNYLLYFNNAVVFNNTSLTIQTIAVLNLTTNSQLVLTANNGQSVQFATAGINTLRFTIQLSNGGSYTTHQRINVKQVSTSSNIALRPVGPNCTPVSLLLTSDIPFQGYDETVATNSHADVHYYYHTINPTSSDCERVLRKPIIIVDGFDPQDTRSFDSLYNGNLKYTLSNNISKLLGDNLRDKGYDVIILNFPKLGSTVTNLNGTAVLTIPSKVNVNGTTAEVNQKYRDGGADYMERNAMLLVKLIQQVNATLTANGSTEKIVVVGPSMGGLVSRYALSYMEKQQSLGVANMNHNCRVWVSFDSPHDGANISPGLQYTVQFLARYSGEQAVKDDYEKKLRAIASRQQLIEQIDGFNSSSTFHNSFYTNLKANGLNNSGGFPLNVRKVNLLNGSGSGINTLSPGATNISFGGFKTILWTEIMALSIVNKFMPSPGSAADISKNMLFSKSQWTYFVSKATITNTNSRGSADAVQGSFNDNAIPGLRKKLDENSKISRKQWFVYNPYFCFIPTVSALGFKQPVSNWHAPVNNRNLVCNNEINFDSYFLAPTNEKHIFLTEANVNWVMQEIEKGQPNCPTICSYALTGGSNTVCINNNVSYSLDVAPPAGTTTQWVLSSNLQLIASGNTVITVKAVGGGAATVTAKIINPCGADAVIIKTLLIEPGTNYVEFADLHTTIFNGGGPTQPWLWGTINEVAGVQYYKWYYRLDGMGPSGGGAGSFVYVGNSYGLYKDFPLPTCNKWYTIKVEAVTSCGNVASALPEGKIYAGCESNFRMSVSPNPAKGMLNVKLHEAGMKIELFEIVTKTGVLVKRGKGNQSTFIQLDVSGMLPDIYTLKIYNGKQWASALFIKE